MAKSTTYVSKAADDDGNICWTEQENRIWQKLYARQIECIEDKACQEYLDGLKLLALPQDRVPQLNEVSAVLERTTGWQCAPVPALIGFGEFFNLLAQKKFPVATFIRSEEEFDYLQEPDIFHEIFGHCPLLTNPAFAKFTQTYGELGLKASKEDRVYLARLYWFTVEFGLMQTENGLKIYGGGILSSPGETQYAMHDEGPLRKPFDALDVLRTPYRIDIMQPVYFLIDHINQLDEISNLDLMALVESAKKLGLHDPLFAPKMIKQAS
ncbi:phenylalanine 4-monooxygenase [Thalassotalea litorea]|uniref:Phenylalanine-4-hydroxylase n=1 Tax=Thalassotalea litorea TaxID=2020715 RepID=A0A5R9IH38_9GAMM|nr:phenylalanine 4-monooxygenase [Thalassotalea litorea]TLU64850.1 phenylalanine 4-monooxygenase [Thalassotalea litorea]